MPSHPPLFRRTAVVFAVLIALQSAGWLLAWQGFQLEAKFEARKALVQGGIALRERRFHKDFIRKIKVGRKEIMLHGQLFDYKVLAETKDSVLLSLYHDRKEEALLAMLGKVFRPDEQHQKPASTPIALWLAKWLGQAFILPQKPLLCAGSDLLLPRPDFTSFTFKTQYAPGIFAPPPESGVDAESAL